LLQSYNEADENPNKNVISDIIQVLQVELAKLELI